MLNINSGNYSQEDADTFYEHTGLQASDYVGTLSSDSNKNI